MLLVLLFCAALVWAMLVIWRSRMETETSFWAAAFIAASPVWLAGLYLYLAYVP